MTSGCSATRTCGKDATRRATVEALGLDFAHASYGSVDEVYLAVLNRDTPTEETLTFKRIPQRG